MTVPLLQVTNTYNFRTRASVKRIFKLFAAAALTLIVMDVEPWRVFHQVVPKAILNGALLYNFGVALCYGIAAGLDWLCFEIKLSSEGLSVQRSYLGVQTGLAAWSDVSWEYPDLETFIVEISGRRLTIPETLPGYCEFIDQVRRFATPHSQVTPVDPCRLRHFETAIRERHGSSALQIIQDETGFDEEMAQQVLAQIKARRLHRIQRLALKFAIFLFMVALPLLAPHL